MNQKTENVVHHHTTFHHHHHDIHDYAMHAFRCKICITSVRKKSNAK